jgi:predicted DsbA family dithiol-disulfide isomerase
MRIEIWSDVVCPWCYIGKRRFESALAHFEHRDQVEVVWRSFELDPNAPRHQEDALDAMLAKKYGVSLDQARGMIERVTRLAAQEGLEYHLERAQRANTFDAHRLLHLAAAHGRQGELKERLLHAYFTEARPIGDAETLVAIGSEGGLPAGEVSAMLASDDYRAAVRADQRRAAAFGIQGVPFFVIDEQFGVSGAQETDVLLSALEQAWARSHPLTLLGAEGADVDLCVDDRCGGESA